MRWSFVYVPGILACQDRIFRVERVWTEFAFNGFVVEFNLAIASDECQAVRVFSDVFEDFIGWRLGGDMATATAFG